MRTGICQRADVANTTIVTTPTVLELMSAKSSELLPIAAETVDSISRAAAKLAEYLDTQASIRLEDVSYTLQSELSDGAYRRFVIADDKEDAVSTLSKLSHGDMAERISADPSRNFAFLFPGVGDHYPGMAQGLYNTASAFRHAFDQCAEVIQHETGENARELLFGSDTAVPPEAAVSKIDFGALVGRGRKQEKSELNETRLAQPLVFAVNFAVSKLLAAYGLKPATVMGYSLGEYVAATCAGVMSVDDALTLVCRRAALIQQQPRGAMLAVALSEQEIARSLNPNVDLAIVNGPENVVLAGTLADIQDCKSQFEQNNVVCRLLDTTHAFHSRQLDAAKPALTEMVRGISLRPPRIPMVSNLTGDWLSAENAVDPGYWARHMCQTVKFSCGLATIIGSGNHVILEVGAGQTLTSFAKQHPSATKNRPHAIHSTLPSVHLRHSDRAFFLNTLGRLWVDGAQVNFAAAHKADDRRKIWLPKDLEEGAAHPEISSRRMERRKAFTRRNHYKASTI